MCLRCSSRRDFVKLAALAAAGASTAAPLYAINPTYLKEDLPPTGEAAWARLMTNYGQWDRHWEEDKELTQVMNSNGLKLSPEGYVVDVSSLDRMLAFPVLFTDYLASLRDPQQMANVREYLYRGGFIYVDGCNDPSVNPFMKVFHDAHIAFIARLLPEAQIRLLPSNSPIFSALFQVAERELIANPTPDGPKWQGTREALWGIYDDDRMVMVLSQEHLRCAWGWAGPGREKLNRLKIQQAANITAYGVLMSPLNPRRIS